MSYNTNNPAIKRLMSEIRGLENNPDRSFVAGPVDDSDLFVWHFTIKGTPDSSFEGGIYHGKFIFPQQYPYKPPDVYFLTPSGRFEINKKLCLSATSFHPETWNPGYDVRTILTSLIAFLPTKAEGAVGALDSPDSERKILARESRQWKCKECDLCLEPDPLPEDKQKEENPAIENPIEEVPEPIVDETEPVEEEIDLEANNEYVEEEINENIIPEIPEPIPEPVEVKKEGVYNFETLKGIQNKKRKRFYPFYDIPIMVLFSLLCFLILNDVLGLVPISTK